MDEHQSAAAAEVDDTIGESGDHSSEDSPKPLLSSEGSESPNPAWRVEWKKFSIMFIIAAAVPILTLMFPVSSSVRL